MEIKKITTEGRNPRTMDIDLLSTREIVEIINQEDQSVALRVAKELDKITLVVDEIVKAIKNSGRLIYIGAGTSGRLGVLDAVECPPTYGVSKDLIIGLMAGGLKAMEFAKEGAEDSKDLAIEDLKRIALTNKDILIGLAASGRTPYVIGGIEYAQKIGAVTSCITTSANSPLASLVDYPIEVITGPEVITGSTRMKAGTAQKLVCNMLTTTSMIKLGKVYQNLMIDMMPTNEKLVARAYNMIEEITDWNKEQVIANYQIFGSVKRCIFYYFTNIKSIDEIDNYLDKSQGNIRKAIEMVGKNK